MIKIQKDKLRRKVNKKYQELLENKKIDTLLCSIGKREDNANLGSGSVHMEELNPIIENPAIAESLLFNDSDNITSNVLRISKDFNSTTTETSPLKTNEISFSNELRNWAVEENVKHSAINSLLNILNKYHISKCSTTNSCFLPKDARTLLKTPKFVAVKKIDDGDYWHFGLERNLQRLICSTYTMDYINISVNIDGLPLFNNSGQHAWPILASINAIESSSPFLIGIWCGVGKPDINLFLEDFITEFKHFAQNGFHNNNKTFPVRLHSFICDAPARSYVKQITSHNGYHGCEKCVQKGKYISRMTYPEINAVLRTDESFKTKQQPEHHIGISPLEELDVNMVNGFGLEYMHLVCLGVVKKMLNIWCFGKLPHRLGIQEKLMISTNISKLSKYMPKDFNRKVRTLKYVKVWKATEYRSFLLYLGPIVLKNVLPKKKYQHFLLLSAAITILIHDNLLQSYLNVADQMLRKFVFHFEQIYGPEHIVYNIHNLIHLAEDCKNLGNLDSWSAFKYENFLGKIKRQIRSGALPLKQIINRMEEKFFLQCSNNSINVKECSAIQKKISTIHIHGLLLTSTFPNNVAQLKNGAICKIIKINGFDLNVHLYKTITVFYNSPINSKILGIVAIQNISTDTVNIIKSDIQTKCIAFPLKNKYVCYPL